MTLRAQILALRADPGRELRGGRAARGEPALPTWERLKFSGAEDRGADQFKRDVLAVLDAVLGGDS